MKRAVKEIAAGALTVVKLTVVLQVDVVLFEERGTLASQPVLAVLVILRVFNISIKEWNQLAIVYRYFSVAFVEFAADDNNLIE